MNNQIDDRTAKIYLSKLSSWAKYKAQEVNPPWALYRYWQLSEVTDIIIQSIDSTKKYNISHTKKGDLQKSEKHRGTYMKLVDKDFSQDNFLHHLDKKEIILPM